MKKTLNVGIIGAGFAADFHAEALKRVTGTDVRLVGIVGGNRQRAENLARRHGIPDVFGSIAELLAQPQIDVVCVCVPSGAHADVVIAAANAGKHVICEKPLTGSFGEHANGTPVDDLERTRASMVDIEAAVNSAGVTFCYAENWVYAPAMTRTKQLLASSGGSILDIRAEEGHSGSHSPLSRRRDTAGGGSLMTLGAHPIAAAIHLKTYEASLAGVHIGVDWVSAQTARLHESDAARRSPAHGWIISELENVETWANVVLGFSDGSRAVVTASFAMLGGVRNTFEVYATNTVIRADITSNNALTAFTPDPTAFLGNDLREKVETSLGWNSVEVDGGWARGYPQEMQDFVDAITAERQPASGLQLACDVVEVIYSAYVSAAENRRVQLGLSLQATS